MKKIYLSLTILAVASSAIAQRAFNANIDAW